MPREKGNNRLKPMEFVRKGVDQALRQRVAAVAVPAIAEP
jgi:hypothetical protein